MGTNGTTIAGGQGQGNGSNQLDRPYGIYFDQDDRTIYIADLGNHRIVAWKYGAENGQVIAGGNGKGAGIDQLHLPSDVIVDKKNDALFICDYNNKRVMRWSLQNRTDPQIIIDKIGCYGLGIDNNGDLYVTEQGVVAVRRWKQGETLGVIVAGGDIGGANLSQLLSPGRIFVDQNYSVYVVDFWNRRVVKWIKDAREGIVVAGGQGVGDSLTQLSAPHGIFIDHLDNVYVADDWHDGIRRWSKGSLEGRVIVGGKGNGAGSDQLYYS